MGFLQLQRAGAALHRGARASHHRSFSCCRAQAPDAQAQYLWLTGPVAPRHVGCSQTRAQTRVPCIVRRTLNHCTTREAPGRFLITDSISYSLVYSDFLFLHDSVLVDYVSRNLFIYSRLSNVLLYICS